MIIEQTSKELLSEYNSSHNIYSIYDKNYTLDDMHENMIINLHQQFNTLLEEMTVVNFVVENKLYPITEETIIKKFCNGLLNIVKRAWEAIKSIFSKAKKITDEKIDKSQRLLRNKEMFERVSNNHKKIKLIIKNVNIRNFYDIDTSIFDKHIERPKKIVEKIVTYANSMSLIDKADYNGDRQKRYERLYVDLVNGVAYDSDNGDEIIFSESKQQTESLDSAEIIKRLKDSKKISTTLQDAYDSSRKAIEECKKSIKVIEDAAFSGQKGELSLLIGTNVKVLGGLYNRTLKKLENLDRRVIKAINGFTSLYQNAYVLLSKDLESYELTYEFRKEDYKLHGGYQEV